MTTFEGCGIRRHRWLCSLRRRGAAAPLGRSWSAVGRPRPSEPSTPGCRSSSGTRVDIARRRKGACPAVLCAVKKRCDNVLIFGRQWSHSADDSLAVANSASQTVARRRQAASKLRVLSLKFMVCSSEPPAPLPSPFPLPTTPSHPPTSCESSESPRPQTPTPTARPLPGPPSAGLPVHDQGILL